MTPIEFVVYEGDSEPNTPVYRVAEAMQKDIIVRSEQYDFDIVGYYFDSGRMVLEIALRKEPHHGTQETVDE